MALEDRSAMACKVGVLEGKELLLYSFPPPHPFTNERVRQFWDDLGKKGLPVERLQPQKADKELVGLFHTKEHIRYVELASQLGYGALDQGDTPAYKGVFEAAQYSVGSTVSAVEKVMAEELDHAFNPVGGLHHATRETSAGFCVFNDIGVAIELLRTRHNVHKILYVDIDVHHGDGVFYSYESDPELFIFDIHEDGRFIYPGTGWATETGAGNAKGTKVNIPLAPGSGDDEVVVRLPRLEEFARAAKPEFIIFQCGADGLGGDPISGMNYSPEAHRQVGILLHRLSHELCSGRLVALGGGGYIPQNCSDAWMAVVEAMIGSRNEK
ncbi:MAG TPA: acetoin utilization protein AcuC [Nitrososphaerales archaeon]|nr:acetoin utilization protein AcuC [Nitrososphaerales archaeon]